MKQLFTLAALCFVLHSTGQNFYFPKGYYQDSIAWKTHMSELARQCIGEIKKENKKSDRSSLFRCQILVEQFSDAKSTLESLPPLDALLDMKTVGAQVSNFIYLSFVNAKLQQSEKQTIFEDEYKTAVTEMFHQLPGESALKLIIFSQLNLKNVFARFQTLLHNQSGKDSISFADAKMLCAVYNSYRVNSRVAPLLDPLIPQLESEKYDINDSLLIATRDGASVAVSIIKKKGIVEKQPAILVFNIYTESNQLTAIQIAMNGYIAVVANLRGEGLSPQKIEPFEHDANDAYDVIDWISKQPWSNHSVGMYGGSYLGFSQWAAVKKVHPALKTIIPQVAVGAGIDFPSHNNIFQSFDLSWLQSVSHKRAEEDKFDNDEHWDSVTNKWYVSGKAFRSLDTLEGRPSVLFQRWLSHPSQDAYWQSFTPYKSDFAGINIPVLTTTGYYDGDQMGALYYFNQHYTYNANANHYLVIGPYDHGGAIQVPSPELDGYTLDSIANISFSKLCFQWFDYILRDSTKPDILRNKINYEVMGENQWKHVSSLRQMNNDTLTFYLSASGEAQRYTLSATPDSKSGFINQEVDFRDRSDTIDNNTYDIVDSTLKLANGIAFVSSRFNSSFEINGCFLGELNAIINKKDMDLIIEIFEQLPDGRYFQMSKVGTIMRASYAWDRSKRRLLTPGKMETIPVNHTYFTSTKISAGSRLVITIRILKSKDWQINYGTGKDVSDETIADAKIPLQIKWYNSSMIKIPVNNK